MDPATLIGIVLGLVSLFTLMIMEGSSPMAIFLIAPSAIEMSNVDLAQEFTSMITAQRGFQANSRVITSADEMLQELVNLKR